jgi:hypothetical protein
MTGITIYAGSIHARGQLRVLDEVILGPEQEYFPAEFQTR